MVFRRRYATDLPADRLVPGWGGRRQWALDSVRLSAGGRHIRVAVRSMRSVRSVRTLRGGNAR